MDLERLKKVSEDLLDVHPGLKSVIQMDEGAYKSFRHDDVRTNIPILRQTDQEFRETRKHLLVPYMYEKAAARKNRRWKP